MQLGAIEINKNNIICAMGNDSGEIMSTSSFEITTKEDALDIIKKYFNKRIKGLGMAISQNLTDDFTVDLVNEVKQSFKVPVADDTYSNINLLYEVSFGVCKGIKNCILVNDNEVGVIANGKLVKENLIANLTDVDNLVNKYSPEKIVSNNIIDKAISKTDNENAVLIGCLMLVRKLA